MRYWVLRSIVASGLLASAPAVVTGQQPIPVEPGARVRLTLAPGHERLVGTYAGRAGDSVEMLLRSAHGDTTQLVSLERITKIEVARGRRRSVGETASLGGFAGCAVGAVIGLLVPEKSIDAGGFYFWTRGATVALWSAVGAGSGVLVGLAVSLPERWAPGAIARASPGGIAAATRLRLEWRVPLGR